MVADDIKVRFSADAVSYQLAASPVASDESLEKQTETPREQGGRENKACNQTDEINVNLIYYTLHLYNKMLETVWVDLNGNVTITPGVAR